MEQASIKMTDLHWRYRVLEKLGQGCQAETFLAEDKLTGRKVVIKSSAQNSGRDLVLEFIRLYRLNHHGLPGAYDLYRQAGRTLAVFEYFPGVTLDHFIRQDRPGVNELWNIWVKLAFIVAYLHEREYIHGDIKPGNILINADGGIKLIDLGLARKVGAGTDHDFTGTPEYSAPEVLDGSTGPSQSSDVYSLGLLLFQMVTGSMPPAKDRMDENWSWTSGLRGPLDEKQSEIGLKALNFWAQERYHSALQLAQALGQSGYGCFLERPDDFRFSGQSRTLAKALEHLRLKRPGPLSAAAGPGRGKTAYLKELNFVLQAAGRSSVIVNAAEARAKEMLPQIPADTILLVDDLENENFPGWLKNRAGQSVAALNPSDQGRDENDTAVVLKKFQKQEYSKVLAGHLSGISNWELDNLSDWIWCKAGSNIAYARSYLDQCLAAGAIGQRQVHWQIDWQKLFSDRIIPPVTVADIGQRWRALDAKSREALTTISLNDGSGSPGSGQAAIEYPEYWLDDSGRMDGDILRGFILEQIDPSGIDRIKKTSVSAEHSEFPSLARWLFWDKTNMQQNWLTEGQRLFEQAKGNNDLEKMLYVGRVLVDSERLDESGRIQVSKQLAALYQRVSRWDKAIELWRTLEASMTGKWEYHQTLATLYANQGGYDEALAALEEGSNVLSNADQRSLYSSYKGWVLSLQGRREEGRVALNNALETAVSGNCSRDTFIEIYNLMARHHQQANDYKQAAHWAEKACGMEISDPMEKAKLMNICGYSHWRTGDLTRAKSRIEESISLIGHAGQNSLLCYAWCNLGYVNVGLKEWGSALLCFQKAESNVSPDTDLSLQANMIGSLGVVYGKLGQIILSKEKYLEASAIYAELDDKQNMIICRSNAAFKEHILGHTAYAIRTLNNCLDLALKSILDHAEGIIRREMGIVYIEDRRYVEGLDSINKAAAVAVKNGSKIQWDCIFHGTLAAIYLNDHGSINDYLTIAKSRAGDQMEKAQLKFLEGLHMAKNNDINQGLDLAMEAAGELKTDGQSEESAKAWLQAGELALGRDDFNRSEKLLAGLLGAEAEFQKMGAPAHLERARQMILASTRKLFAPGNIVPGTQMLEGLYQIAALLDPGKNQAELAQSCLDVTVKLLKAERGGLFLHDENSKLFLAAKVDLDPDTQHDALEFSSNAVMAAATGETMVVSNDAQLDEALSSRISVKRNAIRSLLCLPLKSREGTLGAIYLDSRLKSGIFNQAQRDFTKALAQILGAVMESHRLLEELRSKELEQRGAGSKALAGLIGNSAAVKKMIKRIRAAAPTDVTVLLDGESGTGKEMAALVVHQLSNRRDKKFLALDCGSLPESLLESELFGYVKGAFTGAIKDKTGLFEAADGGTVFLDEIASASPGVQARLLRVIEAGEIRRVGCETVSKVDVRMICATNRDLEIEINEGRFRGDLYYRLKVIKINIPPLRERGDDVLILAEHFKNKFQKKHNRGRLNFSEGARKSVILHSWPGNIRELENTIQKAVLLVQGKTITEKDLEVESYFLEPSQTFKQELNSSQKEKILRILESTKNNYTKAAKIYGISVRHFYRLLDKFGIKRDINVN